MDYNHISAEELIDSIELSLKLANAGIKINYEYSPDNRTLAQLLTSGFDNSESIMYEALESISND